IVLLSGDHANSLALRSNPVVRSVLLPVWRSYSKMRHRSDSYPAVSCAWYAIERPSGEYTGFPSNPGLDVMRFASPPETATTNRSPFVLVASALSVTAVKQISLASGEKLMSLESPRTSGGIS